MSIHLLTEPERKVVYQCLIAAHKGPFFPDWEFQTLFGIERDSLAKVIADWPNVDDTEEEVALAIRGSMGNLVGYPHAKDSEWGKYLSVPPSEVMNILLRWKG